MPFAIAFAPLLRPLRRMVGAIKHLASPYQRYRHAQALHAIRVALAMLVTIMITSGLHIPHGDWASVSMLIVIGGIQHHGNIRKKATERALGTVIGAVTGLAFILVHALFGVEWVTYGLLALAAGICGYYAIGRAGYVALLTAITMIIVAGHGDNSIETGMWRGFNVLVGIVVALAFSFALPLHATYSWRFGMALNLRRCASLVRRTLSDDPLSPEARNAMIGELNRRSISMRNLMPSVAKEMEIPMARLEEIQTLHRSILSTLEMMSATPLKQADAAAWQRTMTSFQNEGRYMSLVLLAMARALRAGDATQLKRATIPDTPPAAPAYLNAADVPVGLQGPYWLSHQLASQIDRLRRLLVATRRARMRAKAKGEKDAITSP